MAYPLRIPTPNFVQSESRGGWLNIYISGVMHLSLYKPSIIKIQTWLDNSPWWKFWNKDTKYSIEITHKSGVQDISEYYDRKLWNDIASELSINISDQIK